MLEECIERELQSARSFTLDSLFHAVELGQVDEAVQHLVYLARPQDFQMYLQALRDRLDARFAIVDDVQRAASITFVSQVTLALDTFVATWNLTNTALHGGGALQPVHVHAQVATNLALLQRWQAAAPQVADQLLSAWRTNAEARFKAEAAKQPDVLANALVGQSLVGYVEAVVDSARRSHLRQIAELRLAGKTDTELGNDYAAFLEYTLYLGVSFVTTNPVLVEAAWMANPDYWNPVMARIVTANSQADGDELARMATLEVVWGNMCLLRPIFLITKGNMGCVSLQVNPKKHGDAQSMVADATAICEELQTRLKGGVPNVVFKLPATRAGLTAADTLTKKGIGVNITVNFGLFQLLRFAEVIHESQAPMTVLSEMNGRLAYPIRDELLAKLPELKALGIDEADVREAAAWSGVAVVRKLQQLLVSKGYDLRRIKPLVASLRVYKQGVGYDRLPTSYPDVTELTGISIITVFPDVRHAMDAEPNLDITPRRVDEAMSPRVLQVLAHSELFKQSYYVADSRWVAHEDEQFRPAQLLALEDEEAVATWVPVRATLKQFAESYDRFVAHLLAFR